MGKVSKEGSVLMQPNDLRVEFVSGDYLFSIFLPSYFLSHLKDGVPCVHQHVYYEITSVINAETREKNVQIVPPNVMHPAVGVVPPEEHISFQFKIIKTFHYGDSLSIAAVFQKLSGTLFFFFFFGVYEQLLQVRKILTEKKYAYVGEAEAQLHLLLIKVARLLNQSGEELEDSVKPVHEKQMEIIEVYFLDNYRRSDFTLGDLADQLMLSERQASRVLKSLTGKTFSQLLLYMRMERAKGYLDLGPCTAEFLAERLGYNNISALYSAYKRYFGCSLITRGRKKPRLP